VKDSYRLKLSVLEMGVQRYSEHWFATFHFWFLDMYQSLIYLVTLLVRNGYSKDIVEALEGVNEHASLVECEKLDVHSRHIRRTGILHLEYLIANETIDLR